MHCNFCKEEHCAGSGEPGQGKTAYIRMGASAVFLLAAVFLLPSKTVKLLLCLVSYLLVGTPILREALANIRHGEIFDENFLMTAASVGAFCIGEFPEAASVMLLYSIGEALQDKAVDSSRRSIEALVHVRPDTATLADGTTVPAESVAVGAEILVRPGERIPLDGLILSGASGLDTSALTGESLPRQCAVGDTVLAGCVNLDGVLSVRVTCSYGESGVSRIMDMVENAQENKARQERFITRFSKVYTPVVCALAALMAVLPPLAGWLSWSTSIHKALSFLVISCPCALVISVPLTFFSGIGCGSRNGILFKGSNHLETLAKTTLCAFDKTGTLTHGTFQVVGIEPAEGITEDTLLETAAYGESMAKHPLAKSVVDAYGRAVEAARLSDIREKSGFGVEALLDGKPLLVGKRQLLAGENLPQEKEGVSHVYVSLAGHYLGRILLADTVKPDAKAATEQLRQLGIKRLVMLSGDRQHIAEKIGAEAGMDECYGELLPEDKVTHLRALKEAGTVLYAGDGINDAPVLALADVGIAMGALGSDAAMESADVVIMSDEPSRIPLAVRIARRTVHIARENVAFSLLIKAVILFMSVTAEVELWLAVFADVGVCMLAIGNSLRALHIKNAA